MIEKTSKRMKGNKYNLGNKPSLETLKKLSDFRKGHEVTQETRDKIRSKLQGKPTYIMTQATRDKMKISNKPPSQKGKVSSMKGRHHTEEAKKKK
jgi:hypothetical protein